MDFTKQELDQANSTSRHFQSTADARGFLWRPWVENMENRVPKHGKGNHRCPNPICKEHAGFKRKPELTRHLNTQHMNNREACEDCGKVFTRKDNLTRHKKSAHDKKSKPACRFCQKPLSRKDAVNRHQASCSENPLRPRGVGVVGEAELGIKLFKQN